MMTKEKPRYQVFSCPSMFCLLQSARLVGDKKSSLRYTFLDVYQGRLKTQITSQIGVNCYTAKFSADVLDLSDRIIGKVQVEVDTALSVGYYSYV
jgi:hypothetical protein